MIMKHDTPEDEFNSIIDMIETRCMAADGPVIPTLQEATEEELSRLWELVNEISPKRKALARKMLRIESATTDEVNQFLINEGLDPEQVAHEGSVFVKTIIGKIKSEAENLKLKEEIERYNTLNDSQIDKLEEKAWKLEAENLKLREALRRGKNAVEMFYDEGFDPMGAEKAATEFLETIKQLGI
jgi:methanogenic corrinoid protein MtbC1